MKKILFGTTALVATGLVAGQASAAEKIALSVGGYMQTYVGFSAQDSDYVDNNRTTVDEELVGMSQDSEIYFKGSTKLDNGITVSARFELEASSGAATGYDDVVINISSPTLGTIMLGDEDNAAWLVHHEAPDVGIDHATGDVEAWISDASVTNVGSTRINNDGSKINYVSPSFGGFGVGAFYQPDVDSSGSDGGYTAVTAASSKDPMDQAYGGAVFFDGEVSQGVVLHGDVGYAILNQTAAQEIEVLQVGASLKTGGLTLGTSYLNMDQSSGASDGYTFTIGAAYTTGPYSISLSGIFEEYEGSTTIANNDESTSVMLSANYNLGPGVDLAASLLWAEFNDESTNKGSSNEGYAFVTGIELSF